MAKNLREANKFGGYIERMVLKYFPNAKKASDEEDASGIDIFIGNDKYQIKGDKKILKTGNLYVEKEEKTLGHEYQEWRKSPAHKDLKGYLFAHPVSQKDENIYNEEIIVYRLTMENYKKVIRKLDLSIVQINPTSKGYLIPIRYAITGRMEFPKIKESKESLQPISFF